MSNAICHRLSTRTLPVQHDVPSQVVGKRDPTQVVWSVVRAVADALSLAVARRVHLALFVCNARPSALYTKKSRTRVTPAAHIPTPMSSVMADAHEPRLTPNASVAAPGARDARQLVGYGSAFVECYLDSTTEGQCKEMCRRLADANQFQRYEFMYIEQHVYMIKGPKIEYYVPTATNERPKYGWGQTPRFWHAGYPMASEPLVEMLRARIKDEFGDDVNHAILKWYAHGTEQSSPPHQDKAEGVAGATADKCDMDKDAAFYIFSFGFPREFTIQRTNGVPNATRRQKQLAPEDIVWQRALASGSLLKVSAADNRAFYHALHPSKGAGERWSLIFRVVKTFIPLDADTAAEVNDPIYRFVSKAQVKAGAVKPTAQEIKDVACTQRSYQPCVHKRARE